MEGKTKNFTSGENNTQRGNFTHRGQNSPLGDNFATGVKVGPRGEVKNGPLF
jgi:hypothetical protein